MKKCTPLHFRDKAVLTSKPLQPVLVIVWCRIDHFVVHSPYKASRRLTVPLRSLVSSGDEPVRGPDGMLVDRRMTRCIYPASLREYP